MVGVAGPRGAVGWREIPNGEPANGETPPNAGRHDARKRERIKGSDLLIPRSRSLTPRFPKRAPRGRSQKDPGSWRAPPNASGCPPCPLGPPWSNCFRPARRTPTSARRNDALRVWPRVAERSHQQPATSTPHQPTRRRARAVGAGATSLRLDRGRGVIELLTARAHTEPLDLVRMAARLKRTVNGRDDTVRRVR